MTFIRFLSILFALFFIGFRLDAQAETYYPRHADDWQSNPLRGAVVELSWINGGGRYEPDSGYIPTSESFEQLRELGANIVVIYVQQTWTLEAPYESIPEEFDLLEQTLDAVGDTLPVVVGIRNGPGRNEMLPNFEDELLAENIYTSESAQQAYLDMLADTVAYFSDYDSIIAWEPMVEPTPEHYFGDEFLYSDEPVIPPMPQGMAWWNDFASRTIETIREIEPDVTIVLEPIAYGGVAGFISWEAFDDDNIVYSLHQYDPFEYTYQVDEPYIEYPYYSDLEDAYIDGDWLEDYLTPVDDFQETYDVPIFVGEWGVIRWVPNAEDFLWDQSYAFDERGWSHALYAWYDGIWDGSGYELQLGEDRDNVDSFDFETPLLYPILASWSKNGQE